MNNVTTGKQANDGLLRGIKIAVDAIRPTYGNKGSNGIVERHINPGHEVANDAQTLVQSMVTDDPVERIGLNLIKELVNRADSLSGDGRKTTMIIADEIISHGFASGLSGMQVKRELDELIPIIEAKIDQHKRVITENDIEAVATVAGESKATGSLLSSIYKVIGKEGIIHLEASGTYQDDIKFIEGVRFEGAGFLSPFMVHDEEAVKEGRRETKAVYENPVILVTKRKISHINDINPLLDTMSKQGKKDLVIFTDDMDSGVASLLVKAHQDKVVNVLIIKAPVLWKGMVFEDFAKVTGSTVIEDASGLTFKNMQLSHLGTCSKIVTDREETTIVGIADITDHVNDLKMRGDDDSKLRLSWLQTKTAILKLGANSESELSHKRLKTADAINSSRLAFKDGVVKGAGECLNTISDELPDTIAGNILKEALKAPHKQIVSNGGAINSSEDIIDASLVIKNAVRNAVSLASMVLTLGVVVHIPKPTKEELAMMAAQSKRAF